MHELETSGTAEVTQLRPAPQAALWEAVVEDAELEELLDARAEAKEQLRAPRQRFKEADERARAAIERLDLGADAPVRVGDYLLTRRSVKGRSVAFETTDSTRLYVRTLKEDEL